MPLAVTIKAGAQNVSLPNGITYNATNATGGANGPTVILSDEQGAKLSYSDSGTGGLSTALYSVAVVGAGTSGASLNPTDEQVLNNAPQIANSGAPARSTIRRYDVTTDVAAALVTAQTLFVPIALYAGDVVTNIAVLSGATAAGTPTAYNFALYSPAGALLAQTANQGSAAWAASTVKDLALTTPQTITTTGTYFVGISVTASTVPSLLSKVLPLAAIATGSLGTQAKLAQISSGGAYGTTAPATIAGATGITGSLNVPYVVVH